MCVYVSGRGEASPAHPARLPLGGVDLPALHVNLGGVAVVPELQPLLEGLARPVAFVEVQRA